MGYYVIQWLTSMRLQLNDNLGLALKRLNRFVIFARTESHCNYCSNLKQQIQFSYVTLYAAKPTGGESADLVATPFHVQHVWSRASGAGVYGTKQLVLFISNGHMARAV